MKKTNENKHTDNSKNKKIVLSILGVITICAIILFLVLNMSDKETLKYTVDFVSNGGSSIKSFTVEANSAITKPEDPTRENYKFMGWYHKDELYNFNSPVTEDIELEAVWEALQNVSGVKLNHESVLLSLGEASKLTATIYPENASNKSVIWESSSPNVVSVDSNGNLKALKQGNATIIVTTEDGHYTAKVNILVEGTSTSQTVVESDKYQTTTDSYTVEFKDVDGKTLSSTQNISAGNRVTKPTNPQKEGYTFLGWYNGSQRYMFSSKVKANLTLTARWVANKYTVKFVNYDGEVLQIKAASYGSTPTYTKNTPTKPSTEKYAYVFSGWSPTVAKVEKDITYTATYTETLNNYTVEFVDVDGSKLANKQSIAYGNKAIKPTAPTKEGHTFLGWFNGETEFTFSEEIKSNLTLSAKWSKNKYTINFVNYDGTILETLSVEHGSTPKYSKDTPTKIKDNTYTYSFKAWDKTIVPATQNETYTAIFDSTFIEYSVTFVNDDGSVLSTNNYHFGEDVTLPAEPTKASNAQYSYTFASWSPNVTKVEKDITYTAIYTKTLNSYTVEFVDFDGSKLADKQTIEYGSKATKPTAPAKEGYTFLGWFNGETEFTFNEEIKSNLTLTAKWSKNKYTINFVNYDGTILETLSVEHGSTPKYSEDTPTKIKDNTYTYSFKAWDKTIVPATQNETYTAIFDSIFIEYSVTFVNDDGSVLSTNNYHFGEDVTLPTEPTKASNAQYSYAFASWSPTITKVEKDITYTAIYTKTLNSYTVEFVDIDGSKLADKQTIVYGNKASKPTAPAKEGHTFLGWFNGETEFTFNEEIKSNLTLTAKWSKNKYTITFVNYDGTILETLSVEHGSTPKYSKDTPIKVDDTQYSYLFDGWTPAITAATKNATYTATYKQALNSYFVTFVDADGTSLADTQTVAYGSKASKPTTPTKEGYTFLGWFNGTTEFTFNETVNSNLTLTAKWSKNKYTIKFVNHDGTVLETLSVEHGSTPKYSKDTPTKAANQTYTYSFKAWEFTFNEEIKSNLTLTAKWSKNKYTITFVNHDGTVLETLSVEHGSTPKYSKDIPTKAANQTYTYSFKAWDKTIVPATQNETYTAIFASTFIEYSVTFVNDDGSVLSTNNYHFGEDVTLPAEPTKASNAQYSYTFASWSPTVTKVEKDVTYTAIYTKTLNSYTVEFVDIDGSKLADKQTIAYGNKATKPTAPTKEGYTFLGWFNGETEFNFNEEIKSNLTLTAKWSKNKYAIKFVNHDGTILETLSVEHGSTPKYSKDTPTKAKDAQYSYTFSAWSPAIAKATEDATYTATFKSTLNSYTVSFVDTDGSTLVKSQSVKYGNKATKPTVPTKEGHTFLGWFNSETEFTFDEEIKSNLTLTAKWSKNKYTIKFVNHDNKVLETVSIEYGETPKYSKATPTKAKDAQYSYTFKGWSPAIAKVTKDTTYTATFKSTLNSYTVAFVNTDGSTLVKSQSVKYGNKATKPTAPTKEGHTFLGWFIGETEFTFDEEIKSNLTLTAKWSKNKYTITFVNHDNKVLETVSVEYGETPKYSKDTPTKPKSGSNSYVFTGWSPNIVAAKADTKYTAQFKYYVNVDSNVQTAITSKKYNEFKLTKDGENLTMLFTPYSSYKPPYDFSDICFDVAKLFHLLSSNSKYESVELYYKYGSSAARTIDLKDYDLTNTRYSAWYGSGANSNVSRWLGYLATGSFSTLAALDSNTNSLVGKTVKITYTLKSDYATDNGSNTVVYYLSFANQK